MGLSESKPTPLTAEVRATRDAAKADMVQRRKAEIDAAQNRIVSDYAIMEVKEVATFFKATEKAKQQLDRNDAPLVKTDLIAILIALQPEVRSNLGKLEEMRVSDLNALIRSIIYDPRRIISSPQLSSPEVTNVSSPQLLLR